MPKYILNENEFRTLIENAIKEELGRLDESLGSFAWNLGKKAAGAMVNPFGLAGRAYAKALDVVGGNDSLGDIYLGQKKRGQNNGAKGTAQSGKGKEATAGAVYMSLMEYGYPDTVADMGKKLNNPKSIEVENFLGSGQRANFGFHYYEKNQGNESSVWSRKLTEAENNISRLPENRKNGQIKKYYREFKAWLAERDKVYKEMIKEK